MEKYGLLAVLAALMLAGCIAFGQPDSPKTEVSKDSSIITHKYPGFLIVRPMVGETYPTMTNAVDLTLVLAPSNVKLVKEGGRAVAGEGHFAISLDGKPPIHTKERAYLFENLKTGKHTLTVEFVNNDFTSYEPKLFKSVSFEVQAQYPQGSQSTLMIGSDTLKPAQITSATDQPLVLTNEGQKAYTVRISSKTGAHIVSKYLKPGESFEQSLAAGTYYVTLPGKPAKATVVVK